MVSALAGVLAGGVGLVVGLVVVSVAAWVWPHATGTARLVLTSVATLLIVVWLLGNSFSLTSGDTHWGSVQPHTGTSSVPPPVR